MKLTFRNFILPQSGFTLIELVVTIALIGILSAGIITLINPKTQINKGNDAKRKADLTKIQTALELYRSDNGYYPTQSELQGTSFSKNSIVYLSSIPEDPVSNAEYLYAPKDSGCDNLTTYCTGYELSTCIENKLSNTNNTIENDALCPGDNIFLFTVINP